LRCVWRGDAEVQSSRRYLAVRGLPIEFGLQRRDPNL